MSEIYRIHNKLNGKSYIGQSLTSARKRIDQHITGGAGSPLVYNAVKKYGEKNICGEVIESGIPEDKLNDREKFWIAEYDSIVPNGYNIREGGRNGRISDESKKKISNTKTGVSVHNEESRRKMSLARKGKKFSEDHRQKMSEASKGKKKSLDHRMNISKGRKGIKLSTEHRQKMSESRTGKIFSPEHRKNISEGLKNRNRNNRLQKEST